MTNENNSISNALIIQEKLELARKLIQDKKDDEGIKLYTEIISLKPDELTLFQIYSDLGVLFYFYSQIPIAIECLNSALNLGFNDDEGIINKTLGFIYIAEKKYDLAIDYLTEALEYMDENPKEAAICSFELAKCLYLTSDFAEAEKTFKKILDYLQVNLADYYASAMYFLGLINFANKRINVAEEYFLAIAKSSNYSNIQLANAFYGMLLVNNSLKEPEKMIEYAAKVMELNSSFADKESVIFYTIKAYQYQNRQLDFFNTLNIFIEQYPSGRFADTYKTLREHEFKSSTN
jgi:tetratricopeptide (TPR) repeat protein